MFLNKKSAALYLLAVFFILDRILKFIFNDNYEITIKILGDYLKFNFAKNYNIAFSLPFTGYYLIIIILLIIFAIIFYTYSLYKHNRNNINIFFLLSILAGAISNFIDRNIYGYVVDYIDLKYFTVFNIADALITLGAIGILITNFSNKKESA